MAQPERKPGRGRRRALMLLSVVCSVAIFLLLWSLSSFTVGVQEHLERGHKHYRAKPNTLHYSGLEDDEARARARAALRDRTVHVVMAFDSSQAYFPLVQASVMSLLKTARDQSRISLHFITMEDRRAAAEAFAAKLRESARLQSVEVGVPAEAHPAQRYVDHGIESGFVNDLNIAHHLYVADTFREVDKAVVLDTDTIVLAPIEDLWEEAVSAFEHGEYETYDNEPLMVAGVGHRTKSIRNYINTNAAVNSHMDPDMSTFGTGVMVLDFAEWRRRDVTRSLWQLVELDEEYKKEYDRVHGTRRAASIDGYRFHSGSERISGTRPLMNILFYRAWFALREGWNVGNACALKHQPRNALILHFSGRDKPPASLECRQWATELWNAQLA
eukprot:TRINITY_DN6271_c0_g1_i1.p1 TRINITY_DN6271_c0_g1~~TRINITY_DN6271_c0_g1_i1.p1  ORF type:complete len:387 (+),score=125.11 TRINITY_DN6271_c0_g1_i1:124-1284(+)